MSDRLDRIERILETTLTFTQQCRQDLIQTDQMTKLSVRSFWERFWNYQQQNRTCSDHQKGLTSKIKYVVSPHEKK
jgi:hypothetical protein